MIQLASFLARPLFGKLPLPEGAKDKISTVNALLTGGSSETWIPLARQQATLPVKTQVRSQSATGEQGERDHEGKLLRWVQFDWPSQQVADCTLHKLSWRLYRNGLICLELIASKDAAGLDVRDLVGHCIELRATSGFLIGVWSAAFTIYKGDAHTVFHTVATDDFLPLELHFDEIADLQDGFGFRI
jgi:hypothetical protein